MTVDEETTLETLRPGALFITSDGVFAVKSEYLYSGNPPQPMCVLIESGEYAHFPEAEKTRVREISISLDFVRRTLLRDSKL